MERKGIPGSATTYEYAAPLFAASPRATFPRSRDLLFHPSVDKIQQRLQGYKRVYGFAMQGGLCELLVRHHRFGNKAFELEVTGSGVVFLVAFGHCAEALVVAGIKVREGL